MPGATGGLRASIDGIRRVLQAPKAADYVLATGQAQSVRHFIELAATHFGFALDWRGNGAHETGIDTKSGRTIIEIDPSHYRPAKVMLPELVAIMAEADDRRVRDGKPLN